MGGKLRQIVTVVAFVALAGGAFLAARHWQSAQPQFTRVAVAGDCDLRAGPCRQALPGGVLVFSIGPREIPLMQPLALQVEVEGRAVTGVAVAIRGLNMDMGLNRTRLERKADGRWHGETILPICSQRRMEWEAAVQLDGEPALEVPFAFHTTRP